MEKIVLINLNQLLENLIIDYRCTHPKEEILFFNKIEKIYGNVYWGKGP